MAELPRRLSADDCRAKAVECRELATRAATERDRIMLMHMADTWDRLAGETKAADGDGV